MFEVAVGLLSLQDYKVTGGCAHTSAPCFERTPGTLLGMIMQIESSFCKWMGIFHHTQHPHTGDTH